MKGWPKVYTIHEKKPKKGDHVCLFIRGWGGTSSLSVIGTIIKLGCDEIQIKNQDEEN